MSDKHTNEKRREFLKGALVGTGAAAVAIASGSAVAAPQKKETVAAQPKGESKGYEVTAHVAEYYKAAQF
jgi:nitrous oxide reductase